MNKNGKLKKNFSLDFSFHPCYTTKKPHNQAQNTPSPKGCHHPYQIQKLEQSIENFVENAHICSKKGYTIKNQEKR